MMLPWKFWTLMKQNAEAEVRFTNFLLVRMYNCNPLGIWLVKKKKKKIIYQNSSVSLIPVFQNYKVHVTLKVFINFQRKAFIWACMAGKNSLHLKLKLPKILQALRYWPQHTNVVWWHSHLCKVSSSYSASELNVKITFFFMMIQ